jgi:hypothetical protein
MPISPPRIATGMIGLVGPVVLVSSFAINPAPPADATIAQLHEFAMQHHTGIALGGWLQGMGSLLLVVFAIALVHLAGAAQKLAGWLTLLAGTTILMVSLLEVTFYIGAAQAAEIGDIANGLLSNELIKAVQHTFLIAPALLIPLGVVLMGARIIPRLFAITALAIGGALQVLGLVGLFVVLQQIIDVLLIVQAFWFMAAGLALMVPSRIGVPHLIQSGGTGV